MPRAWAKSGGATALLPPPMGSSSTHGNGNGNNNTNSNNNGDDLSTIGSILGAVVCFLLFCLIIFSLAYPFTMYRSSPPDGYVYSDGMWWCYHCVNAPNCASRCW
jgi:hypothetical protein